MRTCVSSAGLSLVIATLGFGQGLDEPDPEVGRDKAVAAIRGLGGGSATTRRVQEDR